MNISAKKGSSVLDLFVWLLVAAALVAAIWGNAYYEEFEWYYRLGGVVGMAAVAVGLALLTAKGKRINQQRKEAWQEIVKVVWPTKQETAQTTLVVLVVVLIVALMLYGIDGLLGWIVHKFIG